MTPLILLALLGFGTALTAGSSSDSDDTADSLPEEPQEPDTLNTADLNTEGFTPQLFPGTGATVTTGTLADDFIAVQDGEEADGAAGNDLLVGTDGSESLFGGAGDDTIIAGAGDDFSLGGDGDDLIFLGDGDDQVSGTERVQTGNDTVVGGAGMDTLVDFRGSNQIFGGDGNDTVGGRDNDVLTGENGGIIPETVDLFRPDFLNGGAGDDLIVAQDGDTVVAGDGADQINLLTPTDFDEEMIVVQDFNPDEDVLSVFLEDSEGGQVLFPQDLPTFREDADLGGLTVLFRGAPIALLRGLTEADIDTIEVTPVQGY